MVTVKEVKTKAEQKAFLDFPLDLYRDNPNFVPPLYGDEKKIFSKNYVYNDTCETGYWLAYRGGKVVGRISAILQKASNEKHNEKRVRFTRFDAIDDAQVAAALFGAVEQFAKDRGMNAVCGPLGFSDLEREGLLVEGFDQLSTFEEQYNAEYYGRLIEGCGYAKEVDWVESKLTAPAPETAAKLKKLSEQVLKKYSLRIGEARNVNDFLDRYKDGFFDLLDVAYEDIYGTVPFTPGMKKMMIDNFRLIIDLEHVVCILNEENKVVCLGLCFPSIAKAVQKSRGHLTPAAIVRLLMAIKRPKIIDLGLIAVAPEYVNTGIPAVIAAALADMLNDPNIEYAETNLNLEDNMQIRNLWKRFNAVQHKRRRAYLKELD
ncbi:MAG: N-acetyltransferase [Clostridia bacterium]|nr:N-acetyltransferase [Clostridia bacterium]